MYYGLYNLQPTFICSPRTSLLLLICALGVKEITALLAPASATPQSTVSYQGRSVSYSFSDISLSVIIFVEDMYVSWKTGLILLLVAALV